jgi:hypothetical protein
MHIAPSMPVGPPLLDELDVPLDELLELLELDIIEDPPMPPPPAVPPDELDDDVLDETVKSGAQAGSRATSDKTMRGRMKCVDIAARYAGPCAAER